MSAALPSQDFGPRIDIAARSCAGVGPGARPENQDNYLMIDIHGVARYLKDQQPCQVQLAGWPAGHARVAVLDGMGGHGHGREAAEAVAAGLLDIPACDSLDELTMRLDALHLGLQARFADGVNPERRPGTTLTLLELRPGAAALLYHVGDSRLYQVAHGHASPMTVDHVPATAFAMEGLLGEREWWEQVHGEHRPQISQAFILGNAFDNTAALSDPLHALTAAELPAWLGHLPDRRAVSLDPGVLYVLATDGFWACGDPGAWLRRWPQLFAGAASAADAVDALFDAMHSAPPRPLHPDNLTALVLLPTQPCASYNNDVPSGK